MNCQQCTAKDATIQQQRQEIQALCRIIQQALGACQSLSRQAQEVLKGHQPKGVWSFNRGKLEAAEAIKKFLE